MSEAQAFSLLSILCDRLLPGYYSTTMYGTLLDQKVFESLVEKTMPILWEHLVKSDVQLSVVSLPWFLSLYINSMPLVFAFRVMDLFFLEGPKILFQIGLAILRINGEELLDVLDDGSFINILKAYFSRLDESAHPASENKKLRQVTRFQELMVVALKEFSGITQSTIADQRAKHKDAVLDSIESFAKRTSIRNLGPDSKRLNMEDLSLIYDKFYGVLYQQEKEMTMHREDSARKAKYGNTRATEVVTGISGDAETGRVGIGGSPELMNYDGFRHFLAGMARWAVADSPRSPRIPVETPFSPPSKGAEPADHDFMQRLYGKWNKDDREGLSLQNVVTGIADIKGSKDLMGTIAYFFDLYDDEQDGKVDREGILRISEALLFLSRRGLEGNFTLIGTSANGLDESLQDEGGPDSITVHGSILSEKFLSSVSAFIRRCFEYADPDHPQNKTSTSETIETGIGNFSIGDDEEDLLDLGENIDNSGTSTISSTVPPLTPSTPSKQAANIALDPANPLHITLPTFRMVILADELLQQFFEFSFATSFHIAPDTFERSFSIQTPALTTFSNINSRTMFAPSVVPVSANTTSPKGLRGLLDGIVTDGMRVANEVRKRVDEAQKDLERSALAHEEDDDEDEESRTAGLFGKDSDRRSVRDADRDLLEGGDIGSGKENEGIIAPTAPTLNPTKPEGGEKIIEFET
jgi:hypothetical protein